MDKLPGENLRYLLWRYGPGDKRSEWIDTLSSWLGGDRVRAGALWRGAPLSPQDLRLLTSALSAQYLTDENILYAEPTSEEVVQGNVRYLLMDLQHGEQKRLADSIGVSENTVSRWRKGTQTPEREQIDRLKEFFCIPAQIDLQRSPIFLSEEPVSDRQRRAWLQSRLERLDARLLRDLFPALSRLLESNETH